MENITGYVANLIKNTRKAKGFTQKELGEKMGVGKTTINKYESGKHNITIETLNRIMSTMGTSIVIKVED